MSPGRPGRGPPRSARPGTGLAGGAGRPWCEVSPCPAGRRHPGRRARRGRPALPNRKALAAAFAAVPAACPDIRPAPCPGNGPAVCWGTGLRSRRDRPRIRVPAAAGGAAAGSAAAGRRQDRPSRNPTSPDPATRPGAGLRSRLGCGCGQPGRAGLCVPGRAGLCVPGRAGLCVPGRAERRRPPVAGLAVPVGPVIPTDPARPVGRAREMSAVPAGEVRRIRSPVPDPADTAGARGGGARDGRRPRTFRGRVRRHDVPPGTS